MSGIRRVLQLTAFILFIGIPKVFAVKLFFGLAHLFSNKTYDLYNSFICWDSKFEQLPIIKCYDPKTNITFYTPSINGIIPFGSGYFPEEVRISYDLLPTVGSFLIHPDILGPNFSPNFIVLLRDSIFYGMHDTSYYVVYVSNCSAHLANFTFFGENVSKLSVFIICKNATYYVANFSFERGYSSIDMYLLNIRDPSATPKYIQDISLAIEPIRYGYVPVESLYYAIVDVGEDNNLTLKLHEIQAKPPLFILAYDVVYVVENNNNKKYLLFLIDYDCPVFYEFNNTYFIKVKPQPFIYNNSIYYLPYYIYYLPSPYYYYVCLIPYYTPLYKGTYIFYGLPASDISKLSAVFILYIKKLADFVYNNIIGLSCTTSSYMRFNEETIDLEPIARDVIPLYNNRTFCIFNSEYFVSICGDLLDVLNFYLGYTKTPFNIQIPIKNPYDNKLYIFYYEKECYEPFSYEPYPISSQCNEIYNKLPNKTTLLDLTIKLYNLTTELVNYTIYVIPFKKLNASNISEVVQYFENKGYTVEVNKIKLSNISSYLGVIKLDPPVDAYIIKVYETNTTYYTFMLIDAAFGVSLPYLESIDKYVNLWQYSGWVLYSYKVLYAPSYVILRIYNCTPEYVAYYYNNSLTQIQSVSSVELYSSNNILLLKVPANTDKLVLYCRTKS